MGNIHCNSILIDIHILIVHTPETHLILQPPLAQADILNVHLVDLGNLNLIPLRLKPTAQFDRNFDRKKTYSMLVKWYHIPLWKVYGVPIERSFFIEN